MTYEAGIGMRAGKDLEGAFVGGAYTNQSEVPYLSYKEAFAQVLRLPQEEPSPLVKSIIKEIYKQYPIFEHAGLGYYASTDTAFDYYHGVDCFFILNLKGGQHIVSIDVTQNLSKTHAKADIVIHIDYDKKGAVTIVGASIESAAREIAEVFRRKVSAGLSVR